MKKLLLTLILLVFCFSCGNDDDVVMEPQPDCAIPTDLQVGAIGIDSAELSWNDTNTNATYEIEYGFAEFTLGTGTVITSNQTNVTLTNLEPNTTYNAYIKAFCSATNESMHTNFVFFTTPALAVVPDFLPNLSDLNLFSGTMSDLTPSQYAFVYDLNTALFTDYSQKQRIIALPQGQKLSAIDDGLPNFPDNTVIAKTFFYYDDDRDVDLGKQIIETRILIKKNGTWLTGDYKWNAAQTDAVLDNTTSNVAITYIDIDGDTQNVNYTIPSNTDCATCHSNNNAIKPIGPKLRNLTKNNQLSAFVANGFIDDFDTSSINALPDWDDASFTDEERARAYMDVNCATCHSIGGDAEFESVLRLTYETLFNDSQIYAKRFDIDTRMQSYQVDYSMPLIGVSQVHSEGYNVVRAYVNSL